MVDPEDAPVLMISKPGEDAIVRHDGEMKATENRRISRDARGRPFPRTTPRRSGIRARGSRKTSGGGGGDDDDAAAKKKREEAKRKRETESLFGANRPR